MSERLLQIISSDASTSEHYRDTFRRSELLEPEKALLIALLEDGIHEYRKYYRARDRDGQRRFRKACEWLMADDEAWIFSFVNVCELLNLDPEYVRRGVLEAREPALPHKGGKGAKESPGGAHKHRSAPHN
jgi:hypothetical protein